jgi:hypothetical protein
VIVETIGYADEAYRLRKARMHEIMSAALEGAPVVLHEMSGAVRGEKRDRDRALWCGVGLISGAAGAMESGDDNEEERVRGSRSEGYPRASDISSPPCLPQLLPAGTVSRAGLAPAGKRRLFTAHVGSGHSTIGSQGCQEETSAGIRRHAVPPVSKLGAGLDHDMRPRRLRRRNGNTNSDDEI